MGTSHKLYTTLASMRTVTLAVVGMSALLIAPKCGPTVVVPAENKTPPTVALSILDASGKVENIPKGGLVKTILPGDALTVFVEGKDEDGVKQVTLTQATEMDCAAGKLHEERREGAVHTETNEVKPGEVGTTELYLSSVIRGRVDCEGGLAPRSRKVTVFGAAENYSDGVTTTPVLVVEVDLSAETPPR